MRKGFGFKRQTKHQYIKDFFRNSKEILDGFKTPEEAKKYYRKQWYEENIGNHNNFSVSQLLNRTPSELRLSYGNLIRVGEERNLLLCGLNGLWRISLMQRPDHSLDFDIGVWAGQTYRFHSDVIRDSIITRHGKEVYDSWKALVKSDLGSLRELVQVISSLITLVPWSYTCSESSARLCEQVGISTYRGAAFLFPESYRH